MGSGHRQDNGVLHQGFKEKGMVVGHGSHQGEVRFPVSDFRQQFAVVPFVNDDAHSGIGTDKVRKDVGENEIGKLGGDTDGQGSFQILGGRTQLLEEGLLQVAD